MGIHFANRQAALQHLAANGWKALSNGRFISDDGTCGARILSTETEIVLVQAWEID